VLRFIGHTFEPLPPFITDPADAFVPLRQARIRPSIVVVALSGIVSEFAAALPHRLIVVQLFWLAQKCGYAPRAARPWAEASHLGAAIRSNGWKAYDKTRKLVAPEAVAVAVDA